MRSFSTSPITVSERPASRRDALAQGRRERHLAAHRPLGDRGDALSDPGDICKFVDAFLPDQRRIHIRDQQAFPAMCERLDNDVDGLLRERALERGAPGFEIAGKNKIGRDAHIEPAPALDSPKRACAAQSSVASLSGAFDGSAMSVATRTDDMTLPDRRGKHLRRALLIAGPTASGKSAAALALATRFGATIVNADSMQVYKDLRILTARPTPDEERLAPHRLFGAVDGAVNFSAGRWALAAASEVLAGVGERPVIFVGGTGLYFRALTEGLSDIPPVARSGAGARFEARRKGAPRPNFTTSFASARSRHRRNASIPATGSASCARSRWLLRRDVPLVSFLGARAAPVLAPGEWAGLYLAPDRAALGQRIDARFDAMLAQGALDEVAALEQRRLDPALPVMRAHGVPHLIAHLEGRMKLDEAAKRSKLDTRHYAKRQFTWARHQLNGLSMGRARGSGRGRPQSVGMKTQALLPGEAAFLGLRICSPSSRWRGRLAGIRRISRDSRVNRSPSWRKSPGTS